MQIVPVWKRLRYHPLLLQYSIRHLKTAPSISVTSIGGGAFSGCSGLTTVTLPDSVSSMGKQVFSGCTNLETVVLPETADSMGSRIFEECTKLISITLPEGITFVEYDAFYGCTSLESVILPESLESIAYNAFRECTSLKEISLPKNLTSIGNNAFCDCSSLTKVTFKGDYPELSSHSFCSVIADGYYPSTWTVTPETSFCQGTFTWHVYEADAEGDEEEAVDEYTYTVSDTGNITITSYNWKNKEVSIPDTLDGYPVVAIGEKAFFENTDLEVLKLPDTITTIGTEAFSGCTGLKEIFFKNDTGLPTIGANAFLNVSANGYHPLTWNISPVSVFYGGTINWENVGTVYLAMS